MSNTASWSAVLEDARGHNSITISVDSDDRVTVLIYHVPQPFVVDEPPATDIELRLPGPATALLDLRGDLRAHLNRPLVNLAGRPFTGSYALGADDGHLDLDFGPVPPAFIDTSLTGGSYLTLRWRGSSSEVSIGMFVDITTLDRLLSQLGHR
jgi:hypothetical protein